MLRVLTALTACAFATAVAAQPIGPVVERDGIWELRKSRDSFTDKTACVITPTGQIYVQISRGSLYINYSGRGGIRGWQIRLDEGQVSQMTIPGRINERLGILQISGPQFDQIMKSRRLRIQALTLISGIKNEDFQLNGLARLYQRMMQTCFGANEGVQDSAVSSVTAIPPATRLRQCLALPAMTKERLDCYDAIIVPQPRVGARAPKIVTDCRQLKEEDDRVRCFDRFAAP